MFSTTANVGGVMDNFSRTLTVKSTVGAAVTLATGFLDAGLDGADFDDTTKLSSSSSESFSKSESHYISIVV
jgi:hypothetical protein